MRRKAEESPDSFYKAFGSAFVYPLKNYGWVSLVAGALAFWLASWIMVIPFLGWILGILVLAYVAVYAMDIVADSAGGKTQLPDWPDITNLGTSIAEAFFLVLPVFLISSLPSIGVSLAGHFTMWEPTEGAELAAKAAGGFYAPMAFLAVSVWRSPAALNPFLVLGSILRVPVQYLGAFAVLVAARVLQGLISEYLPQTMLIGSLATILVWLYFVMVECRMVGLIHWTNRDRLGWLR